MDAPGIHISRREVELIRRGCRSEENYKQSERDTECKREMEEGEGKRGVRKKERDRNRSEAREREREKPDSAPPYATTCIDRGLCHWIPPVVGRFLSLC